MSSSESTLVDKSLNNNNNHNNANSVIAQEYREPCVFCQVQIVYDQRTSHWRKECTKLPAQFLEKILWSEQEEAEAKRQWDQSTGSRYYDDVDHLKSRDRTRYVECAACHSRFVSTIAAWGAKRNEAESEEHFLQQLKGQGEFCCVWLERECVVDRSWMFRDDASICALFGSEVDEEEYKQEQARLLEECLREQAEKEKYYRENQVWTLKGSFGSHLFDTEGKSFAYLNLHQPEGFGWRAVIGEEKDALLCDFCILEAFRNQWITCSDELHSPMSSAAIDELEQRLKNRLTGSCYLL
jgi:hypothetical protein